ncbi:MAG: DUF5719 family protein [Actinomycetota bacterium]
MRGLLRAIAPVRVIALVAVGVGLLLGAVHLPAPINLAARASSVVATTSQADPVTQTQSVCPGPEALGVEGLAASPAQNISVVAVAAPVESLPSGFVVGHGDGSLTYSGLPSGGTWSAPGTVRGQLVLGQVSTAQSVLVTGAGSMAPGTVAAQWSWTAKGDSRGLVTSACVPASVSSWLVAGGAAPGRLEHLVLANPASNPVTVDLTVLGTQGPIEAPNGQDLVVGGHSRTVILLDAIAGTEPSPVVHVTARGGKVAAFLSDTWLDGVVPRGGDDVSQQAAPAREQVIAGVPVDGGAILRVAVPGDTEAVVQSRVLTTAGPEPLTVGGVTRVPGGSTKDIDLSSLPPGAYAVQVTSDIPVVAAAMVDRRQSAGAPSDLAWSVASEPIKALAGMALPAAGVTGLTQQLELVATKSPASVRVTTVGTDGLVSTNLVAVGADSVSMVPLAGATSVWVTPIAGIIRAGVLSSVTDAGGVALSQTPLTNLRLTATPSPLRQLRD